MFRLNIFGNSTKESSTYTPDVKTVTIKEGVNVMSRRKLSKTARVLNLLNKGNSVSWQALRTRFDLKSPRAMVDKLRARGHMIYINKSANGTSYRVGEPTKAIIAAGIKKLYGIHYAYNNVA